MALNLGANPPGISAYELTPPSYQVLDDMGGFITITWSGSLSSAIKIRLRDMIDDTILYADEVTLQAGASSQTSIEYKAFWDEYDRNRTRVLQLEYIVDSPVGITYEPMAVYFQYAALTGFMATYPEDKLIPQAGGEYEMMAKGEFPDKPSQEIQFTFKDAQTGEILISPGSQPAPYLPVITSDKTPFSFIIPENETNDIRSIDIFWVEVNTTDTIHFDRIHQRGMFESQISVREGLVFGLFANESDVEVYVYSDEDVAPGVDSIAVRAIRFNAMTLITDTLDGKIEVGGTLTSIYPLPAETPKAAGYLTIPSLQNNGWGTRPDDLNYRANPSARLTFEVNNGREWVKIDQEQYQNNFFLSIDNTRPNPSLIPANGGFWNIKVMGRWYNSGNTIMLRPVEDPTATTGLSGPLTIAPPQSATSYGTYPLSIPPTNTAREIYLQFSTDGGTTWEVWDDNGWGKNWTGKQTITQAGS